MDSKPSHSDSGVVMLQRVAPAPTEGAHSPLFPFSIRPSLLISGHGRHRPGPAPDTHAAPAMYLLSAELPS